MQLLLYVRLLSHLQRYEKIIKKSVAEEKNIDFGERERALKKEEQELGGIKAIHNCSRRRSKAARGRRMKNRTHRFNAKHARLERVPG